MGILILILLAQFSFAQNFSTTSNVQTGVKLEASSLPKYQIFYFWATWCPDCKEKITSDLSQFKNKNLDLIAVSTEKDLSKVKSYVEKNNLKISVFYDENRELQKFFKIFSVPSAVLTEKKGSVFEVLAQVSGTDWSQIKAKLEEVGALK